MVSTASPCAGVASWASRASPGSARLCAIILAQNARPRAERSPMAKVKRAAAEPVAATSGRPDWIVVALALIGLGIAGYLTALKLGGNQAFLCRDGSGCDIVQASRYSLLAGVP